MKNFKKLFILIACLIMIFTAYKIIKTYALFESEITGTANIGVGKWRININGNDVTSGSTHNFTITSLNISQSSYTKNNKIAPGMDGNFTIEICPRDTQVSIRYDIFVNDSGLTNSSMNLVSISEQNHNKTLIQTAENTYTAVIPLSEINNNYSDSIKIEFEWINDEQNNENDTIIGTQYNAKIYIPIEVNIKQYLGEEIVEYNGE